MAGTPGHTFQSFPGSLDGESVGKSTSSEPSVATIFNSRFGANSSGNHRALETPEFFSWSLRNTRVYSGTLLLPLPPPSIDHNPGHCWLPWKISSVQFSCSVVSHSATNELLHARLPCLSPAPGACSNSRPLNQWCHLTISSSVLPFSSCHQSFPASGSFPMSQFFPSGQSIGVHLQHQSFQWIFRILGLTGWISL